MRVDVVKQKIHVDLSSGDEASQTKKLVDLSSHDKGVPCIGNKNSCGPVITPLGWMLSNKSSCVSVIR
jgi:hypothetical protein